MDKNSPDYKRTFREELSRKFCQLNDLKSRTDLNADDRRQLRREGKAEEHLNQGHYLHAHKCTQEKLSQ